MMCNLQKMGGIAALMMATTYIVGLVVFSTVLNPGGSLDPIKSVAFLTDNETIRYITILFIYVVAGLSLLVLVQALYERLKAGSPAMMQTTAILGFIWAGIVVSAGMIYIIGMDTVIEIYHKDPVQAASVWLAVKIVFQGLGGGTELVGGLWALLLSWVALRSRTFPKLMNYLGLLVGVAGVVTIVPAFEPLTLVFGVAQIPWFIWIGIILLQGRQS